MRLISILLVFLSSALAAQDAGELYRNKEYKKAIIAYEERINSSEADSSDYFQLASSQSQLMMLKEALLNFKEAKRRNYNASLVDLNIAKIYAKMGDKDRLIDFLNHSVEDGLFTYTALKTAPEFAKFKDNQQFLAILDKVELNAYPCLGNKESRHFDFWLGEWDVYLGGNKVGENSITRAVGGCAIHENYTTGGNYAGQSINFYDPIDKKWHQHWVGSSGDVYNYLEIDRREGYLQFLSEFYNPDGSISLSRLTFSLNDDGTVNQLFENSIDEGKTWSAGFNGLYKRK